MGSQLSQLLFIVMIMAVFWFLIMRPQQQRQKQQREMLDRLAIGDDIVTVGGIFGTVVDVGERVRIRVYDGSEFEVARQAIGQVQPKDAGLLGEDEPLDESDATNEGDRA